MTDLPAGHHPADTPLTLTTLGAMRLHSVEESRLLLGPGKPLALFVYLHCAPRRTANREHLLEMFWRDQEPERGRHALRQVLYSLRQTLGDGALATKDQDLVLTLRVGSDRDEFLEAIAAGELGWAVDRYGGDFLPRFACPGGAEFEQWADLERDRLRTIFVRAAESVARGLLARGRHRDAQAVARRIRETRPDDQSGWRILIEAYLGAHDRVHATAEAEALEGLLSAEGREVEPATRNLLRQVRQEAVEPGKSEDGLVAELVGREQQFSAIIEAWSSARASPARHVHIRSPAGLGKTRLLNDVTVRLRAGGARVVHLRARPGERNVPCAFAGDLAHALASLPGAAAISPASMSALVSLHPALSARFSARPFVETGVEGLRLRTMALAEAVAVICEETPLALLVDDLHWLDDDSFQAIEGVLSRNGAARLLTVTTSRPVRDRSLHLPNTQELELSPVTENETRELIASLGQLPAAEWAEVLPRAVHGAGRGSPLEILETLRLAIDSGSLILDELGWQAPHPATLLDELKHGHAIRQRIERLDSESRWLLLALATAGSPLSRAELGKLVRHNEGLDATLEDLERRGFIHRIGDSLELSHDAIGEVTVVCETEDRRRAADAAIGRMLASVETPSLATLLRAGRHLSKSGDGTSLRTLFGKVVETARDTGDARRPGVFATELARHGKAVNAPELIASLSLAQRYGIRRSWIGAGAALAGALLIGSLALLAARDGTREPDQVLLLGELGGWLTKPVIQVPLRRDDWPDGVEIDLERTARLPPRRRTGQIVGQLEVSPDGLTWLYGMETGDSNTVDVVVDREGEPVRKVLHGLRDDGQGSWLPDGAGFAGLSARWSPRGADDYDGVIVSLPDGSVRRITSSRDHDNGFRLSPDGTRLAWTRRYRGTGRPELCWNNFDATAKDKCFSPTGSLGLDLGGWGGTDHLIFLDRADTNARLFSIDLRTERLELLEAHATSAKASPDGRWLAVHALRGGNALPAWYVYPALEPARARPLPLGNRSYRYDVAWGAARDRRYLDSVAVLGPDSVDLGTAMRFRADGMDASRRPHTIPVAVSWSVSDSGIATIDSSGTLTPRTAGMVRVRASAGGWRTGVRAVHLVTRSFRIVEQESWQEGIRKRWIPFGDPPPDLAKGPDGIMAFWNRGDGSFASGAYSRFSLGGTAGAGVEALVSMPLTRDQWQQLQISLVGGLNSASAAGWDHRTGGGPFNAAEAASQCGFSYPTGEGEAGHGVVSLHGGGQDVALAAPRALKDGTWHQVRLQIFPDGTCGLAINGKAVARTSAPVDLERPFAVRLGSSSVDTRILVGPLEAWEGIRPGVNWDALRRK